MSSAARITVRVAAAAVGAYVAPAATWLPGVRRLFPKLSGIGRPDHVALTFDDGPDHTATPAFLDALGAHGVRATFFVVGERVAREPDLVWRMIQEGHEVGVHGWRHRYALVASPQLDRCVAAVTEAGGVRPSWYRPAYGVLSASCLLEARRALVTPVLWTAWAKDWTADTTADSITTRLSPGIVGGATLLLHDESSHRAPLSWTSTLAALPDILRTCADRGLHVGALGDHGVR